MKFRTFSGEIHEIEKYSFRKGNKKNRAFARFWWKDLTDYDFFCKMTGLKVVMKKIDAFFEVFYFILFTGLAASKVLSRNLFQE